MIDGKQEGAYIVTKDQRFEHLKLFCTLLDRNIKKYKH